MTSAVSTTAEKLGGYPGSQGIAQILPLDSVVVDSGDESSKLVPFEGTQSSLCQAIAGPVLKQTKLSAEESHIAINSCATAPNKPRNDPDEAFWMN